MPNTPHHDEQVSLLRRIFTVVVRRRWIVIACAVIVPLAAYLLSSTQEPRFAGKAEVLLNQASVSSAVTGAEDTLRNQEPERVASTQSRLARVPEVARRTLTAAGLTGSTDDFLADSEVRTSPTSDIMEFYVYDRDAAEATRLTNEYARQYIAYRQSLELAPIQQARSSVQARIAALERRGVEESARRRQVYLELVRSEQRLSNFEALQGSAAVLVREAGQAVQVEPKGRRSTILGLGLGIFLGLGLAFIWEALDSRVRRSEEIGDRLDIPLLGRIPRPSPRLRREGRLVMLEDPRSHGAESIRSLRTSVELANLTARARTIMLTSSVDGEGKSTTAANLGVALARAGRSVLLVDLDLRRPSLARLLGAPSAPGATEVALGEADLDATITVIEGDETVGSDTRGRLELMPAGTPIEAPNEFLDSTAVTDLIARLRERADFVLIDAPPLLGVGDALGLSTRVDAMVMVCRVGILSSATLGEVKRVLDGCPALKLGFVLTDADREDDSRPYRSTRDGRRDREGVAG